MPFHILALQAGVKHFSDDWENKGLQGFIFVTTLLHPKSRGAVTLRSSDPFDAPRIGAAAIPPPVVMRPVYPEGGDFFCCMLGCWVVGGRGVG